MTSRVRVTRRSLTLAGAAAVLVGVPLLAGPTASAQEAGTVTFSGGCGVLASGVGGNATPDAAQVSVASGSGVRFTNQLGQAATLRLDGEPAAEVPAGGTADVVFHDGPVAASMQISCLLGKPAGTVTVEVSKVQPADPADAPAAPPRDGGSGSGASSQGGSSAAAGSPDGEVTGDPSWGGWHEGVVPPPAGEPDDAAPRAGRETRSRDGDPQPRWGVEVEPPNGSASSSGPATVDQEPGGDELAVDQVSRTTPSTPDDGPVGLLALIATVCVVGVSAGAVRALISQRAHRAEWA